MQYIQHRSVLCLFLFRLLFSFIIVTIYQHSHFDKYLFCKCTRHIQSCLQHFSYRQNFYSYCEPLKYQKEQTFLYIQKRQPTYLWNVQMQKVNYVIVTVIIVIILSTSVKEIPDEDNIDQSSDSDCKNIPNKCTRRCMLFPFSSEFECGSIIPNQQFEIASDGTIWTRIKEGVAKIGRL